jgi:hypothetical protein
MNKRMLRENNSWALVRLYPIAKRFDGGNAGIELPQIDDEWRIGAITKKGIPILNLRTHHGTLLTFDQVRNFDAINCILVLKELANIGGRDLWFTDLPSDTGSQSARHTVAKFLMYAKSRGYTIDKLVDMLDSGMTVRQFCSAVFSN